MPAGEAPPPGRGTRPMRHGDVAIAAIASCTNTANPWQVVAAGLLARNAAARGLRARPWVKASMSPGSRVVTAMLEKAGLLRPGLRGLGFGSGREKLPALFANYGIDVVASDTLPEQAEASGWAESAQHAASLADLNTRLVAAGHAPVGMSRFRPNLVLAPLLAFDARGRRLGYGKGHYDRAVTQLRATGRVFYLGLAYAQQQVDAVPVASHDLLLDWVETPLNSIPLFLGRAVAR
jgi:hypothetical protein